MPLCALVLAVIGQGFHIIRPIRTEIVNPIHIDSFNKGGKAQKRVQGGNPRTVSGRLVFDGALDGNRQVDPQIAVGGGYVFHATNSGLVIYDKKGNYVDGVPQSEFNGGIDPKLVFDVQSRTFVMDMWNPWDKPGLKPVNISVSQTDDPRGAWNTYPVSETKEVDGGGVGCSRKWIGYSFPGGPENTFVMKMDEVKAGKPATVYSFEGSLGHPVLTQDPMDDLLFVELNDREIILRTVGDNGLGVPVVKSEVRAQHHFNYGWPPASPMKGTTAKTASGDHNPKNLVVQSGHLWFSHTVNVDGRAAVQWHELNLNGEVQQSGLLSHPTHSYIETTLAVNKRNDVVVGFQETGPDMFISARAAWRHRADPPGKLGSIIRFAEGVAATEGGAWGDYSGSVVDGDNLTDLWTVQSAANAAGHGNQIILRITP